MNWQSPLSRGILKKRYKRFMADVVLDSGDIVTAHCANPGAMLGLKEEGMTVWLSKSANPNRALAYSWELVEADGTLVGINTAHPNRLVLEALKAGVITALTGYDTIKPEAVIGQSRLDFKFSSVGKPDCYMEVKNCHLKRGPALEFPDSVTERGAKHLQELITLKQQGVRAVMLYVGQRGDCSHFSIAADIDPAYAGAFAEAMNAGVEMLCYDCAVGVESITIRSKVAII